jgi:DNA polymerase III subunit epsilon
VILCSFDTETTGLDVKNDHVIEVGSILYSTGLKSCLESSGYLVKTSLPISEKITQLTGIHPAAVEKFGYESEDALDALLNMMSKADAVIGQNVIRFDKRILESWAARHGRIVPEMLWIDTRTDIPGVEGKHLSYMAADQGFLNLFPHSALADCQTVIKLIEGRDIDAIVERAKSPIVILRARVSYETNKLAKARKYSWNPEHKIWWRICKQIDLPNETGHGEFEVDFVTDIAPEVLMYS